MQTECQVASNPQTYYKVYLCHLSVPFHVFLLLAQKLILILPSPERGRLVYVQEEHLTANRSSEVVVVRSRGAAAAAHVGRVVL